MTIAEMLDREDVLIFDTETTGFARWSEIVEISIIDTRGDVRLNTVVMPRGAVLEDVVEVHGLTKERLAEMDAPRWPDVFEEVQAVLGDAQVLAAYNFAFDRRMIEQTNRKNCTGFDPHLTMPSTCCIMREYKRFASLGLADVKPPSSENLSEVYTALTGEEPSDEHRALPDCLATLEVMRVMARHYREAGCSQAVELSTVPRYTPPASTRVEGKRFVITGEFAEMSRSALIGLIKCGGGRVTQSASKRTDYLVRGNSPGMSKMRGANEHEVPVIGIAEVLKMLGSQEIETDTAHDERVPVGMVRENVGGPPIDPANFRGYEPPERRSTALAGMRLAITGAFAEFSRREVRTMISDHGGEVMNHISRKTDYLVAGERAGSKLAKAGKAGTSVITIHQFLNMIQPHE